jgi:hypothetical protein
MNSLFYNLSVMVSARVREAIQLACEGHKDEARHWYYFVEQTVLVKILKKEGFDVLQLQRDMIVLRDVVHPDSNISAKEHKTELDRIADKLEQLENFIKQSPALLGDRFVWRETGNKN